MISIFIRFFTFDALNVTPETWGVLGTIYLILLICTWFSIFSSTDSNTSRSLWLLTVTLLPFVGMAAYTLRCLLGGDFGLLHDLGFFRTRPADLWKKAR